MQSIRCAEALALGTKEPQRRLKGRRVVLTGASSGIGAQTARLFAREGADLALLARSEHGLQVVRQAVESEARTGHVIPVDVGDRRSIEAAVNEAAERLGGIDVLISNAGSAGWGPFEKMTPEDFDRTIEVNFTGAVNAIRAALPYLHTTGGTIVATVSVAGKVPVPFLAPYVAGKHALRGFLGVLRIELANQKSNIRVCMVHPAPIATPYYDHATSALDVQPKPLRSAYHPDVVAQALLECALRPRAEVTVGGSAAALSLATTFARPLSDRILATYGVWGAISQQQAKRPGILWQPSGTGNAQGSHRGRRSAWTALRLRTLRLLRNSQTKPPRRR